MTTPQTPESSGGRRPPKKLRKNIAMWLLSKPNWLLQFIVVSGISLAGLFALNSWTYEGAPPKVGFVSAETGKTVISYDDIQRGQELFHLRGLMAWGSFWGDGAERGPDFTADSLHRTVVAMRAYYEREIEKTRPVTEADRDAIKVRIEREIKHNGYDAAQGFIRIQPAQVHAFNELVGHYTRVFTDPTYPERFRIPNFIHEPAQLRALTAFFFWGSWVAGAQRPGEVYSYTHNWPYDPEAGNLPSSTAVIWSILSILALMAGTMLVLYVYGQMKALPGDPFNSGKNTLTTVELEKGYEVVRTTQRSTYKFFAFAMILFVLQVFAGILSAEDFVGGGPGEALVSAFGLTLPFTVVRSYHTILQIYWFFMCWVGYTLFFLPRLTKVPKGQGFLINLLFGLCVLVGVGALVGIYLGHMGYLSDEAAFWLGSQGWEFLELGRLWHVLMLVAFVLWVFIIFRGVRRWITKENMWSVPAWLFYGSGVMVLFLFLSLGATTTGNWAIANYWRWMNVHMWVEVTFEVFTTCIVGYLLVQMGLLRRAMAERVIFLAVMMFVITAVVGIAHNFYWIAKPTGIIALGSVFSTLQVIPLLLITLDAWRMRRETYFAQKNVAQGGQKFVMEGVWRFIVAVNVWNIIGAGVFGSLINLPIVNYFEHGTYLTGNHAHAAMFGVKGNIAIGGMLFCCQHLFPRAAWNEKLIKTSFWSLQIGLILMMTLDLFPVGIYQVANVLDHGFWYARTAAFVTGDVFTTLTWMRTIGGVVFFAGGVAPLVWFILSRARKILPEGEIPEGEWSVYNKDWAAHEEELVRTLEPEKT